jgi:hypothetical protein
MLWEAVLELTSFLSCQQKVFCPTPSAHFASYALANVLPAKAWLAMAVKYVIVDSVVGIVMDGVITDRALLDEQARY